MYAKVFEAESSESSSAMPNKQKLYLQWRFESCRVFKPGCEKSRFAAIQAQFWPSKRSIICERLRENSLSSFSKSNNKKPTLATQSFRKHPF